MQINSPQIKERSPIKVRPNLEDLGGYHSPQVDVEVRLNTNESPLPPPKKFLAELKKRVTEMDMNRYPDREATRLKEAIADFCGVQAGGRGVAVGNGSNEILQALLLTYVGESGKVAVFEPTYALHTHISKIVGAEVITGTRTEEYHVNIEEFKRVLDMQPNLIFLCSPNNPTGTLEDAEFLNESIELAAQANVLLVIDEAYGELSGDRSESVLLGQAPVVIVRTFSKAWSLAGLRLGYAIAPEWIIKDVSKTILPYNINAVSQTAGELILQFESDLKANSAQIIRERELLFKGLRELNDRPTPVFKLWDSAANFIFFKVLAPGENPGANSGENPAMTAKNIWNGLLEDSILIRHYPDSPLLKDCLRVTVGTPAENKRFLDSMAGILNAD